MCCLVTILLLFSPRVALVVWWLMDAAPFHLAFNTNVWPIHLAVPFWIWPLLGIMFLPWTTLAYLLVAPGGVGGMDWLWIGIGVFIDLGSHIGGGYGNRDRLPGYSS
jgi:hypothetical protein